MYEICLILYQAISSSCSCSAQGWVGLEPCSFTPSSPASLKRKIMAIVLYFFILLGVGQILQATGNQIESETGLYIFSHYYFVCSNFINHSRLRMVTIISRLRLIINRPLFVIWNNQKQRLGQTGIRSRTGFICLRTSSVRCLWAQRKNDG